jgi:hypothetical protein
VNEYRVNELKKLCPIRRMTTSRYWVLPWIVVLIPNHRLMQFLSKLPAKTPTEYKKESVNG